MWVLRTVFGARGSTGRAALVDELGVEALDLDRRQGLELAGPEAPRDPIHCDHVARPGGLTQLGLHRLEPLGQVAIERHRGRRDGGAGPQP